MDEQFDNDLRDRIREVFDNYEDPTANDGWLLLREKFPEERKRRVIAWIWWGAAAVLLVLLGAGLWLNYNGNKTNQLAVKTRQHSENENIAATNRHNDSANHSKPLIVKTPANVATDSNSIATAQPLPNSTNINKPAKKTRTHELLNDTSINKSFIAKGIKKNRPGISTPADRLAVTGKRNTNMQNNAAGTQQVATALHPETTAQNNIVATNQQALTALPEKNAQNSITTTKQPVVTDAQPATLSNPATIAQTSTKPVNAAPSAQPAQRTMEDVFKQQSIVKSGKKDEKTQMMTKKVVFGVYAATYFNYAKGSDNEVNAGGGVTADIKLGKNFKLITGITVGQNSLSYNTLAYNSGLPVAVAKSGFFAPGGFPSASTPNNVASADNMYMFAATPALKNYSANLVALDVPLNLKYEFNPDKTETYVAFGFSSGTFINEAYTYQYNYPAVNSASLQQNQNQTAHNSFNSFYFAKTLNAAFGFGLPFAGNRVVVEPFLKYPLQGMGSQQIKFGSGGLNLKFNFKPAKK